MEKPIKICFIGYKQLSGIARKVIDRMTLEDTEVILKESLFDSLQEVVAEAVAEGCEVFIAGSANAAEFRNHFHEHLVEIQLSNIDYLRALKRAGDLGGKRPVIAVYRYSRPLETGFLKELSSVDFDVVEYEDYPELYSALENAPNDVVIGASFSCEIAAQLGKQGVLVYAGEDSVVRAIQRARILAAELRREAKRDAIVRGILEYTPAGVIITDESDEIIIINDSARRLIGQDYTKVRGKKLSVLVPALDTGAIRLESVEKVDRVKLINGAMLRCVQTRIDANQQIIGVLTILYPDNSRKKKSEAGSESYWQVHGTWKDVVGESPAMKETVALAKLYADSNLPIMLYGPYGTGKNFISHCIHNGSKRAAQPYVSLNAATIAPEDTARTLYGYEDSSGVHKGLFETAAMGTIAIHGLSLASRVFQACLLQVLTEHYFYRVRGNSPVMFNASIVTLSEKDLQENVVPELVERLAVLPLTLPTLSERSEDIPSLFRFFLRERGEFAPMKHSAMESELLSFYSWPGNITELSSVCRRYSLLCSQNTGLNADARYLLLVRSIGEDKLLKDIKSKYPALEDPLGSDIQEIMQGIDCMKKYLRYNESIIAQYLNLSRTTLWRMKKRAEAERKP